MTSEKKLDVVVVGGCFVDMMVYAERLPVRGETMNGTDFKRLFGGKGANICVMAAKLGARTAMIARVGKDFNGTDTILNFKKVGVNTEFVLETEGDSTGVATCYVDCAGEPAFVSILGANRFLCCDDIDKAENLISSAKVLVCPKAIRDLSPLKHSFKIAKKHGLLTVFNIAPAVKQPLDPEFYDIVDIVIVNTLEAERITGVHVETFEDAEKALEIVHERGVERGVVTLGKNGACCSENNSDGIIYYRVEAPIIDNAIDSTGSGDAFCGALAYYLSTHPSLTFKDMVERSVNIASETVKIKGSQTSYPAKDELPQSLFI